MIHPPRYGTPRRPDRATTGTKAAHVARLLGVRLHPWQRHVLDVAGELDPATGRHVYRYVNVSVGRRAGKSLLQLVAQLRCMFAGRGRRGWYTSQSGKFAALMLTDEWAPAVEDSVFASRVTVRRSNGSESFTAPALRSTCRVFAPHRTALHSASGDLICFDEAWAHSRYTGDELIAAASPLTMTRPGAQIWRMSAAGDVDSTWWLDTLDDGRAAAAADSGYGVAHFEWSADHPDLDPSDPAVWSASHPAAYPGGTVTMEWLRDEYDRDPTGFARSVLNITDRSTAGTAPIDVNAWQALHIEAPARDRVVAFGVDVAAGQSAAVIVACTVVDEVAVVEVVDYRPGHDWIAGRCAELYGRWPVQTIAGDFAGQSPAAVLARPLEAAGLPVDRLALVDVAAAAADFVAAVRSGTVRHVPHPALDDAVAAARRRPVGDGSWTFQRLDAAADTSPLIAAAFARWSHPDTHQAMTPHIA